MGGMGWRVAAREQAKLQFSFWRKGECEDETESREIFLLVAEDEHWPPKVPVPLVTNFLGRRACESDFSRDFLVRVEGFLTSIP